MGVDAVFVTAGALTLKVPASAELVAVIKPSTPSKCPITTSCFASLAAPDGRADELTTHAPVSQAVILPNQPTIKTH
jgi:hypothetical protein